MNPYALFKQLLGKPQLKIGEVTSAAGGKATIELPDGGVLHARGVASVGQQVFVRDGVIEGQAPALTVYDIDV